MAAPNQEKQKPKRREEGREEILVRIAGQDVSGSKNIFVSLTRIKGVSWSISNAVCRLLNLEKTKKVSELSKDEIKKIEEFLKEPEIKDFLKNRKNDLESGESKHYTGASLEIKKDFDIRRMKKIRSYKGIRHSAGLPVRGQKTRSHFRKKGQAVRVRKKK